MPWNAAWPRQTWPQKPVMTLSDSANRIAIAIVVSKVIS